MGLASAAGWVAEPKRYWAKAKSGSAATACLARSLTRAAGSKFSILPRASTTRALASVEVVVNAKALAFPVSAAFAAAPMRRTAPSTRNPSLLIGIAPRLKTPGPRSAIIARLLPDGASLASRPAGGFACDSLRSHTRPKTRGRNGRTLGLMSRELKVLERHFRHWRA